MKLKKKVNLIYPIGKLFQKAPLEREAIIKPLELDTVDYQNKLTLGEILYKEAKKREEESIKREFRGVQKIFLFKLNLDKFTMCCADTISFRPISAFILAQDFF